MSTVLSLNEGVDCRLGCDNTLPVGRREVPVLVQVEDRSATPETSIFGTVKVGVGGIPFGRYLVQSQVRRTEDQVLNGGPDPGKVGYSVGTGLYWREFHVPLSPHPGVSLFKGFQGWRVVGCCQVMSSKSICFICGRVV